MPDGRGPEHRFSVFHLLTHPVHHAEEFGLTDGEKKALVGLREKLLYPTIEKEKALEATRFALRDTLGNPDFDAGKARDLAKKIGALESELRDLAIGAAVEVRKLLGAERYAKLTHGEDEHKPRMLQMMMRHGGPPPGPGHPEGPPPGAPRPEQPPPRH
jgi:Spy/CpxP family protein refolding chaperone